MKYIIFLVLILIIIFMYFYYENKLNVAKDRIRRTTSQFNSIRNEYRNSIAKTKYLDVQFIRPSITTAIANNESIRFLAPTTDSPKLKTLNVKMEVKILDSAIVSNETWFYVSLPIDTPYNCRGWINKNDFSFICPTSQDISTNFK